MSGAAPVPRAVGPYPARFPALQCPPVHFVRAHLGVRDVRKKSAQSVSHRVLGVCFTGGIWRAGALPLRGQQEALVKEVSRKLFSSEQASGGREAHRGSVSGSEHSWAVQAPPAAPAAVRDVWFG